MIYADQRWIGNHGIGRFARHVLGGLDYCPVPLNTHPAAPLDAWRLARELRNLTSEDLFFSPGYNTPLSCSSPFIFTIHDLSHVYCPENSSSVIRLYYATLMRRACRGAARILTVSEFTRRQIIGWSGVPAEKVINVGCGVEAYYRPEGERYGLPYRYLLCPGNRKKHKNEFRAVEAFAMADIDPGIQLVFLGEPTTPLSTRIRHCGIESRARFVGVVDEPRLPSLYRGAEAVIFPSLYEGFGLPLVEAMACGTPVVTSNVTAMPEVAGDAALLVNPTSVDEIAVGIERVVKDGFLGATLRARGLQQAGKFSWTTTRRRVHAVLVGIHLSPSRRQARTG